MSPPRCILVDVEGTTTPIQFVREQLFPLVREQLASFLERHWSLAQVQESVALLREQAKVERDNGEQDCPLIPHPDDSLAGQSQIRSAVQANVLWQMDHDRKSRGLKALQGQIWRDAYMTDQVKGAVFDDAVRALQRWHDLGIPVYVYSSGSVEAQKLLFEHSAHGNLQPLFAGNFDTTIGSKLESASYCRIAELAKLPPQDILFLSDNIKEIEAAKLAGMQVAILDRPGNAPLDDAARKTCIVWTTFDTFFT